jgi:hypothetical protein
LVCTFLNYEFLITNYLFTIRIFILNVIIFEGAKLVKKHELSNFLKEKHDYEQYNLTQIKEKGSEISRINPENYLLISKKFADYSIYSRIIYNFARINQTF